MPTADWRPGTGAPIWWLLALQADDPQPEAHMLREGGQWFSDSRTKSVGPAANSPWAPRGWAASPVQVSVGRHLDRPPSGVFGWPLRCTPTHAHKKFISVASNNNTIVLQVICYFTIIVTSASPKRLHRMKLKWFYTILFTWTYFKVQTTQNNFEFKLDVELHTINNQQTCYPLKKSRVSLGFIYKSQRFWTCNIWHWWQC